MRDDLPKLDRTAHSGSFSFECLPAVHFCVFLWREQSTLPAKNVDWQTGKASCWSWCSATCVWGDLVPAETAQLDLPGEGRMSNNLFWIYSRISRWRPALWRKNHRAIDPAMSWDIFYVFESLCNKIHTSFLLPLKEETLLLKNTWVTNQKVELSITF